MIATGIRQARERQARDLVEGPARGLYWDQAWADRVVEFIEKFCVHVKGEWAGKPFIMEPWQADDIIRPIFGWKMGGPDGPRRFRFAYVEIPRKNGKSIMAAVVGHVLLILDDEAGAEIYSTATKKDQAKIVWEMARKMAKGSHELSSILHLPANSIVYQREDGFDGFFQPLGADSNTMDGLNAHGNLVDELHAHRDRHVYDVIVTSEGTRRQPLNFMITTAGIYDPTKIGWQQHEYAEKVLEGSIEDDSYFAFVAAADKDDDWKDPEVWKKANPNLGVSVKLEYLENLAKKAESDPGFQNTFRRYHLNQWTQQVTRWLDMDLWRENGADPVLETELAGRACHGGLDLADTDDINALIWLFPRTEDLEAEDSDDEDTDAYESLPPVVAYDVLVRLWVPEDTVADRILHSPFPYDAWVRDGWLRTTPGNVTDTDTIRKQILEDREAFQVESLGIDPWNAMDVAGRLQQDGLTVEFVRQGMQSLGPASKQLVRTLKRRGFHHPANPVLTWMASNVAIVEDSNGNIRPAKDRSVEKIDGIVAAVIALGQTMAHPQIGSIYTRQKPLMLGG